MTSIYDFLEQHNIPYEKYEHPAVFTCEEAEALPPMPGADTKNLFVKAKKSTNYYLVVVGHAKSVDLKQLSKVLGVKGLSFGNEEMLRQLLGVTPGSATIMGLITDANHQVEVVIDKSIWQADAVQCHPLVNTATLVVPHEGIEVFLQATGHVPKVIEVPSREV